MSLGSVVPLVEMQPTQVMSDFQMLRGCTWPVLPIEPVLKGAHCLGEQCWFLAVLLGIYWSQSHGLDEGTM